MLDSAKSLSAGESSARHRAIDLLRRQEALSRASDLSEISNRTRLRRQCMPMIETRLAQAAWREIAQFQ